VQLDGKYLLNRPSTLDQKEELKMSSVAKIGNCIELERKSSPNFKWDFVSKVGAPRSLFRGALKVSPL